MGMGRAAGALAKCKERKMMRDVNLIVVGQDGVTRPGYMLRAGDLIESTDYDHGRRRLTVTVTEPQLPLLLRLRRWWEGWRRRQERWGG
jgi:hypothetical protein